MERNIHLYWDNGDLTDILQSIAKWTKFLSIVAFTILGLSFALVLTLGFLILSTNKYMEMTNAAYYTAGTFNWFYVAVYLLVLVVYFIPVYYLYRFAVEVKKAILENETETLNRAFLFLRKHYMFMGIFAITSIVIYIAISAFLLISFL